MNNKAKTLILFCVLLVMAMFVATGAQAGEKVVYRLKWLRNVSVVGALYAETHHLFEKAGLDVEVKAGGPERDAIRELELGYADFGEASADQVLRARAKGSPVVVIAQLFQVNPLQWMYRPEELQIGNLADLQGKVIGITFGGNDETIMNTMLAEAGLGSSDVKLFSVRYDYTPFYRRQVQLWPVYRNAQAPLIEAQLGKAGEETAFFNPAEFGVKFVANCVVTESRTLTEKPELVKRFLAALLGGWQQALDPNNQEEAIETLQKYDPDTPRPILEEQLKITRELIQPDTTLAIGTIDEKGWEQTERIMRAQKQLPKEVDLKAILRPVGGGAE
ncbi:MAG: nitrate ABC transporter substrate-binding protein [Desulfobulbaceae bacterium BRH_c16a]|nr:MAG: nitrate ABC transporter substrate-binding protein [Desulfobulbaceae bacterium BRH_c16a]